MASHVVVVDSSFRRHTIKTTPNTYLSDILSEASRKFGVNADQYTLKHNGKPIDISRTFRLSGLTGGAKLDLVQASRSPSVVSVALQLPNSGDSAGSLARLTDKFPSDTTIWQILRRFESGAAAAGQTRGMNHNFTQRATPLVTNNKEGAMAGSGRLVYEMPVVTIMSRSLSTFPDLQRTLGQLGFNSGSCLLRLSYNATEQPLEEALVTISRYFEEVETTATTSKTPASSITSNPSTSVTAEQLDPPQIEESRLVVTNADENLGPATPDFNPEGVPVILPSSEPRNAFSDAVASPMESTATRRDPTLSATHTGPSSNGPLSIFAPPSSSIPAAAKLTSFNEADYTPTVEHAQTHQARLTQDSRNKKLLSDDELAAQAAEKQASLSTVSSVNVRIRFPDQSQAQQSFDQSATVRDLYQFCRSLMDLSGEDEHDAIELRSANKTGKMEHLHEDGRQLIWQLGWRGGVLVTVAWGAAVKAETRRRPALKPEYRAQAQTLKPALAVTDAGRDADEADQSGSSSKAGAGGRAAASSSGRSPGEKEARLKKLLGFGKKK